MQRAADAGSVAKTAHRMWLTRRRGGAEVVLGICEHPRAICRHLRLNSVLVYECVRTADHQRSAPFALSS